jgi:hypothetical protein
VAALTCSFIASLLLLPLPANATTASFLPQPGGVVAIVLPSSVLADRDVHRQIASGLTTTFILVARARGSGVVGSVRIDVRFDLWDEVWLVHRTRIDGKEEEQRITSSEMLERWWSMPIRILRTGSNRVSLSVTLTALPFSSAEGKDARDWIAHSVESGPAESRTSPLVTALIGTTLAAKPIRVDRWTAEVVFP